MKDLVIGSKTCPVCQATAVVRGKPSRRGSPTFRCEACGSELRPKLTAAALWALPAKVLMLAAAYVAVGWFRDSVFSSPTAIAAVSCGLVALSVGISSRMALRMLTFARA